MVPDFSDLDATTWSIKKIAMLEEMVGLLFEHLLSTHDDPALLVKRYSEAVCAKVYASAEGAHSEILMTAFDAFFHKTLSNVALSNA